MARPHHCRPAESNLRFGTVRPSVFTTIFLITAAAASVSGPASAAKSAPGLPIRSGAYAEASSQCGDAGSSDLSWFGGGYVIQSPHARCSLKSVRRLGKADYLVVETCLADSGPGASFRLINKLHIVSPRQYRLSNSQGHFAARWCRD